MSQTDRTSRTEVPNQQPEQIYDLCTFAKSTVLRLTPPNNKAHIAFKTNKLELKYHRKTERKRTATPPNNKAHIALKRNKLEAKYGRKTERKITANVDITNVGFV